MVGLSRHRQGGNGVRAQAEEVVVLGPGQGVGGGSASLSVHGVHGAHGASRRGALHMFAVRPPPHGAGPAPPAPRAFGVCGLKDCSGQSGGWLK